MGTGKLWGGTLVACTVMAGAVCAQTSPLPIQNGVKILFVGNSYTQNAGGLDNRVEAVAAADVPPMTINADQAIMFAVDLDVMWNSGPGPNMLRTGGYDIMVLQGWEYAASNVPTFLEYAKKFCDLADSVGTQPVFFCPWAMTSHNWMNAYTQYEAANDTAAARAGAPVVHLGRLWWDLRTGRPLSAGHRPSVGGVTLDSLFMFNDAIHPDDSGQYINALSFYAFFTNKSPVSLGPTVSGFTFSEEFQDTMQARVWKSVRYDAQKWYGVSVTWQPVVSEGSKTTLARSYGPGGWNLLGATLPATSTTQRTPGVYLTVEQKALKPATQVQAH